LATVLFPWVYTIDKRSKKTAKSVKNVHNYCHIPQGVVEEMKVEIDDLQKVDHDLETRFAVVEESLKEIKGDVKQVLMHLTLKGIDK
jgi:hypothetical protein